MWGWWRRLRSAGEPDPDLAPLTRRGATALRGQLASQLRTRGALVHYEGPTAVITEARRGVMRVRLADLAREVAASQHPRAAEFAARQVVDMVFTDPAAGTMDAAALYRGLRLRVTPTPADPDSAARPEDAAVLTPFTLDTSVSLVLDTEHTVQTMPLSRLRELDDMDTLIRAARGNLRTELRRADVTVARPHTRPEHEGAWLWTFESGSVYTASAALIMEDVLPVWAPELDTSEGVLFAMPTRHSLLARPVTSGTDLLEGLGAIAGAALEIAHQSSEQVSPLLHVSYLGEVTTISGWDPDTRELTIRPTPHLLLRIQNG
ncbi:hypothetical protein [Corynebacterium guangdongense]|uniref:Uncharacterized protein n=1 Tax=Corynebacterium guangdongense TaxID=1783348 RepID=A0ABU1ZVJ4_9CORY|nr:hypothetical protein [Corynebacterium guangdongense]MDR7328935.1 hypothetical protein [Corynebacterium guangdongense]WJZ17508.1 hypothetical protein CGUA_04610 [Corynebacterium guangdongense]